MLTLAAPLVFPDEWPAMLRDGQVGEDWKN